jgi:type VI protein secretion system component Hcp
VKAITGAQDSLLSNWSRQRKRRSKAMITTIKTAATTESVRERNELTADALEHVSGGRKAGGSQQEYLVVKMNDVIVTSVSH